MKKKNAKKHSNSNNKKEPLFCSLIIPDAHFPFVDRKAWELMLKVGRSQKVDELIVLGDMADCYAINSHGPKHPQIAETLKDEVDSVNAALDQLDKLFPKAKKKFLIGNHSFRLERFLQNKCPELFGFIDIETLFKFNSRLNWTVIAYGPHQKTRVGYSKLWAKHEPPASNPERSVTRAMCNVIAGHNHRLTEAHTTNMEGEEFICLTAGFLGNKYHPVFNYLKGHAQWQLGFALVWSMKGTKQFWHQLVHIKDDYSCVVGGKMYKYEKS